MDMLHLSKFMGGVPMAHGRLLEGSDKVHPICTYGVHFDCQGYGVAHGYTSHICVLLSWKLVFLEGDDVCHKTMHRLLREAVSLRYPSHDSQMYIWRSF